MNKIIEKELEKIKVQLPEYSNSATKFFIPKSCENDICINHTYLIKLKNYIVSEPEGFTLSTNWNNGIKPKTNYLKATYLKNIGKMYQFYCCEYDLNEDFTIDDIYNNLWLPKSGFDIIKEFKE